MDIYGVFLPKGPKTRFDPEPGSFTPDFTDKSPQKRPKKSELKRWNLSDLTSQKSPPESQDEPFAAVFSGLWDARERQHQLHELAPEKSRVDSRVEQQRTGVTGREGMFERLLCWVSCIKDIQTCPKG